MAQSTAAEQAAYNAGFNRTKKQQARDKGAADAGADPILEAARQRALAPQQPAALNPRAAATVQATKPSGRFIETPEGRVPEEFYNLSPEQQKQFRALVEEEESAAESESLALKYSKMVGDQQEEQGQRIRALESQLDAALSAMEAMNRRMRNINTSVEVSMSEALVEQESAIAQQVTNLAAVKAEAESSATTIRRETEIQRLDHDARIAALEHPVAELEGRVKSSVVLMGERGNAVVDQLASIEGRVATAEVNQTEIDNGIKVNRDTLRAATGDDLKSVVDMNVKQAFDDRLDGAMDDLIQRKYVLLSGTNGTDGYDPKRDDLTKPFLTAQVGDNATERAVNRALKKAGRR